MVMHTYRFGITVPMDAPKDVVQLYSQARDKAYADITEIYSGRIISNVVCTPSSISHSNGYTTHAFTVTFHMEKPETCTGFLVPRRAGDGTLYLASIGDEAEAREKAMFDHIYGYDWSSVEGAITLRLITIDKVSDK